MRAYDREHGRALASFVVFPHGGKVLWWLLSDGSTCGLADPVAPDFHVIRHAMRAEGHIMFDDYVLVYANKKSPRVVPDARFKKGKEILKDVSSWTWKVRSPLWQSSRPRLRVLHETSTTARSPTRTETVGAYGVLVPAAAAAAVLGRAVAGHRVTSLRERRMATAAR